jgi:hypothetical protein
MLRGLLKKCPMAAPSEDKRAKALGVTGDLARAEMVGELGRGYGGQGQVDSKGWSVLSCR